jgi:hypothetical protein
MRSTYKRRACGWPLLRCGRWERLQTPRSGTCRQVLAVRHAEPPDSRRTCPPGTFHTISLDTSEHREFPRTRNSLYLSCFWLRTLWIRFRRMWDGKMITKSEYVIVRKTTVVAYFKELSQNKLQIGLSEKSLEILFRIFTSKSITLPMY